MKNKIKEAFENKSVIVGRFDKQGDPLYYDTSWFCSETKTIHTSLKNTLNCKFCNSEAK